MKVHGQNYKYFCGHSCKLMDFAHFLRQQYSLESDLHWQALMSIKVHHYSKVDGQICQSKILRFNPLDFDGIPWKSMDFHLWPLLAVNASSGKVTTCSTGNKSFFNAFSETLQQEKVLSISQH